MLLLETAVQATNTKAALNGVANTKLILPGGQYDMITRIKINKKGKGMLHSNVTS